MLGIKGEIFAEYNKKDFKSAVGSDENMSFNSDNNSEHNFSHKSWWNWRNSDICVGLGTVF